MRRHPRGRLAPSSAPNRLRTVCGGARRVHRRGLWAAAPLLGLLASAPELHGRRRRALEHSGAHQSRGRHAAHRAPRRLRQSRRPRDRARIQRPASRHTPEAPLVSRSPEPAGRRRPDRPECDGRTAHDHLFAAHGIRPRLRSRGDRHARLRGVQLRPRQQPRDGRRFRDALPPVDAIRHLRSAGRHQPEARTVRTDGVRRLAPGLSGHLDRNARDGA